MESFSSSKLKPKTNQEDVTSPKTTSYPVNPFRPNIYKLQSSTSTDQSTTSTTSSSFTFPTFAPFFSITPFVNFDSGSVPARKEKEKTVNRRTFKITPTAYPETTTQMDMEIIRQYFPEIELKKLQTH